VVPAAARYGSTKDVMAGPVNGIQGSIRWRLSSHPDMRRFHIGSESGVQFLGEATVQNLL
jgi:hypothetical protein